MTDAPAQEPGSWRADIRHLRRDVRELKTQMHEVRRWIKTMTALLIAMSASAVGALLSTLIK